MSEEAPRKTCLACKLPMPASAQFKCPTCGSEQELQLCVVCRKPIPKHADYCNECKSYQGRFRRHLPISSTIPLLLGFLLTLATTALWPLWSWYSERNSHTFLKVTGADENHIFAKVWNTGRKPSTLVAYRLRFGDPPEKEFMLDLSQDDKDNARNVIASGAPQRIAFTDPAEIPPTRKEIQYSREELVKAFGKPEVIMTLEVDVKESNDLEGDPKRVHPRRDTFTDDLISAFLPKVKP